MTINFDRWIVPTTANPSRNVRTRIKKEHHPEETINPVWDVVDIPVVTRRVFRGATLSPAVSLADGVDQLMNAQLNVWDREWWYCDATISALHLDALRFALLRRGAAQSPPQNGDDVMATIGTSLPVTLPGHYAGLPVGDLNKPSTWLTWDSKTNPRPLLNQQNQGNWFMNVYDQLCNLQVGDHIVFNNHVIYAALSTDAFRLENAVVTALESNPANGSITLEGVRLTGLGMPAAGQLSASIKAYAQTMAAASNGAIKAMRLKIQSLGDTDPKR